MITRLDQAEGSLFQGLRLTVEEYYALGETAERYELIDGVAVISPGPTPRHQRVTHDVLSQLQRFVDNQPMGEVLPEVDVHRGAGHSAGDLWK